VNRLLSLVLVVALSGHLSPAVAGPSSFDLGVTRGGYLLGAGDRIKIAVFEYEEYSGQQEILPDGTISLPLVGSVRAAERTPEALASELTDRLRAFLTRPVVSVGLVTLRPVRVNVAGEVQRPGPVQLRIPPPEGSEPGTVRRAPTAAAALAEAGGVTRDADIRRAQITRLGPGGERRALPLNLWEAIWSPEGPTDPTLQDGDVLYIPKLATGDPIDRRLLSRSSFAPKTLRVRVVGEVKKPGEVDVLPDGSIAAAVAVAGGPTDKADLGQVTLTRLNGEGRIEARTLNLTDLANGEPIRQGDVILVPKSGTSAALDFANLLFGPFWGLNSLVQIFR